jgi:hypothetical protein
MFRSFRGLLFHAKYAASQSTAIIDVAAPHALASHVVEAGQRIACCLVRHALLGTVEQLGCQFPQHKFIRLKPQPLGEFNLCDGCHVPSVKFGGDASASQERYPAVDSAPATS